MKILFINLRFKIYLLIFMILQISASRIFFIFGIHPILIIFFLYVAYLILKRNKNPITLTLSVFYILTAIGFTLNIIFILLILVHVESILSIVYFITTYLILFPQIFLVIFILHLLHSVPSLSKKKQMFIICTYGILSFIVLLWPGGITINSHTNWIPIFSWQFLIVSYIFFTCSIFIPTIVNLIKMYKLFKDKGLKKKLRYFSLGIFGTLISLYGLILYNTWDDPLYKLIWGVLSLFIVPISAFLIYYGIGHNL